MAARGLPTQLLWTERGLSHLPPDWRQILLFHGFCQSLFLKNAVAVQGIIHYANLRSTANRTAGLFWPRFRERELELHWLVATSRNISTVSQSDCRLNNDRCAVLVRTHLAIHCIHVDPVYTFLAIAYERGAAHAHMCTAWWVELVYTSPTHTLKAQLRMPDRVLNTWGFVVDLERRRWKRKWDLAT